MDINSRGIGVFRVRLFGVSGSISWWSPDCHGAEAKDGEDPPRDPHAPLRIDSRGNVDRPTAGTGAALITIE